MENTYNYNCPLCSTECSIVESLTAQNVVCPNCAGEFFATPPDNSTQIILPEKLPFFKSAKKKLLHQRFEELVADGELSSQDEDVLTKTAILLGLEKSDLESLARKGFLEEISTLQRRVEQTWQLTDEDLAEIETLKNKYGITRFRMEGNAGLFRQVYLLEAKGQMPPAISADWMLDADERAYYCIASTWHQTRVRNHGYAGASFSVPTGMRGVRLRFGQYSPVRSEEVTPLASGTLWVTSKRLVFQGDTRNTKVDHKKIIDTHIYSDSLRVDKATGKPDYFSMSAAEARYISSLIGALKS